MPQLPADIPALQELLQSRKALLTHNRVVADERQHKIISRECDVLAETITRLQSGDTITPLPDLFDLRDALVIIKQGRSTAGYDCPAVENLPSYVEKLAEHRNWSVEKNKLGTFDTAYLLQVSGDEAVFGKLKNKNCRYYDTFVGYDRKPATSSAWMQLFPACEWFDFLPDESQLEFTATPARPGGMSMLPPLYTLEDPVSGFKFPLEGHKDEAYYRAVLFRMFYSRQAMSLYAGPSPLPEITVIKDFNKQIITLEPSGMELAYDVPPWEMFWEQF